MKTRMATDSRQRTRRLRALSAEGATHPHPQAVADPLFRDSAFFDPNDLVQVKYEMLRSVQKEGRSGARDLWNLRRTHVRPLSLAPQSERAHLLVRAVPRAAGRKWTVPNRSRR